MAQFRAACVREMVSYCLLLITGGVVVLDFRLAHRIFKKRFGGRFAALQRAQRACAAERGHAAHLPPRRPVPRRGPHHGSDRVRTGLQLFVSNTRRQAQRVSA